MKAIALSLLRFTLKWLARFTLARYRPGIVGVTGSVGKTSTKLAIAATLGSERRVRSAQGNFNNELGLPLTILGEWERVSGILFWPKVIGRGIFNLLVRINYPEVLILEYGADKPGDLAYLLSIAKPNVSVVTAVGEVPVHVEFYSGPEEVAREKGRLVEYLPVAGFAILNTDDEYVRSMEQRTRAHVVRYGFEQEAEVRITHYSLWNEDDAPRGISFRIEYGGKSALVRLRGAFGKAQAYAAAASIAVGTLFGMHFVRACDALARYRPPPHRMELVPGVKDTMILDDSYNASPLSMQGALETLAQFPAKRRVTVLGDMLELGKYSIEAHEHIGRLVAERRVDLLITVGPRAQFIAEAARDAGIKKSAIHSFSTAEEAQRPVQDLVKKGDLILIKASRAMQLEKIVEEIRETKTV